MIRYDPRAGCLVTALRLRHTVLPKVACSAEFWVFMVVHLAVFVAYRTGYIPATVADPNSNFGISWKFVEVVTAMATFFGVFYSNQCYARYTTLYKMTKSLITDVHAFAFCMRGFVGKSRHHVRLAVRYMTASVLLNFYNSKGQVTSRDWAELLRLEILHQDEVNALKAMAGPHPASYFLVQWSALVADLGAIHVKAAPNSRGLMTNILLKIRDTQQDMEEMLALPVPFQYFHLLSLMLVVNQALFCYAMALNASIFSPVVFAFSTLVFMGMMELSSELSDPFGTDEVDFPMDAWLSECVEKLVELVEYDFPGGAEGMEQTLKTEVSLPKGAYNFAKLSLTLS